MANCEDVDVMKDDGKVQREGRTCTNVDECIEQLLIDGKQCMAKNELRSA